MNIKETTRRLSAIIVAVALTAPNSSVQAAEESDWIVQAFTDRMTAVPVWFAGSKPVAPQEPLGWRFDDITSYVVFGCTQDERSVSIDFSTERPKLRKSRATGTGGPVADLLKLFGVDRLIRVRTRWDDTSTDMTLVRTPDEPRLDFFDDGEAARLLKRARTFLVEFHWDNGEVSYFRYSLTGSRAAIERAERECKAQQAAQTAAAATTRTPEPREDTHRGELAPVEERRTPQPAHNAAEAAIAELPANDQAWVRSSCSRDLGPSFWTSCVERELQAIRAGMPDISKLAAGDQAWVRSSCSRDLGPSFWTSCVGRELQAIRAGMPDISKLAAGDQAWIRSSCSRDLGPAFWTSCVERELQAIRAGMPDISKLAAGDQAWIRSSCSRDLGPSFWANCVQREAQTLRPRQ